MCPTFAGEKHDCQGGNAINTASLSAEGNEMQYPAAFIINEEGIITYSYYSSSMMLPSIKEIV